MIRARRMTAVLALAFLAGSCASTGQAPAPGLTAPSSRPPVLSSSAEPLHPGAIYGKGEGLYSRGRYMDSARIYLQFISQTSPDNPLVDNAYFKAGMSMFELGRYRDADNYFKAVTERFPASEVYTEALINHAICRYQLNEYDAAQAVFTRADRMVTDQGRKAYISFYLGNIAEKKSDFTKAADNYIRAEFSAHNEELVIISRSRAERIFHNFMGEKQLVAITEKYGAGWPARVAFEELIRIYRRAGASDELAKAKAEYDRRFLGPMGQTNDTATVGDDNYAPETVKIGAALALTGAGSDMGKQIIQGIQLAFSAFYHLVKDKKAQLIIKDTGAAPGGAVEAVRSLAADKDVSIVIGPVFTDEFENSAVISKKYRIPLFSPSASGGSQNEQGNARLFRNSLTEEQEAEKLAQMAVTRLGLGRFAILYPGDEHGRALYRSFEQTVTRLGASVIVSESYNPRQTDFGEQIRRLGGMTDGELAKAVMETAKLYPNADPVTGINPILDSKYAGKLSAPQVMMYGKLPLTSKNFRPGLKVKYDAIFIPGAFDKVGLVLPELEFYNLKGITKLAGRDANNPELVKVAERYSEGLIFLDGFFKQSQSPLTRSFVRDYQLSFHEDPTTLAAQAYDTAMIVLSSIAHGATSRSGITRYLETLSFFEGVTGVTTMGPGGFADKEVLFLTVKDGKIAEYEPPAAPPAGGNVGDAENPEPGFSAAP